MTAGLIQYVVGRHRLKAGMARSSQPYTAVATVAATPATGPGFTADEWKRIGQGRNDQYVHPVEGPLAVLHMP